MALQRPSLLHALCTNVCLMRGDDFFKEYNDEEEVNNFQNIGGCNNIFKFYQNHGR